MKSHIFAVLVFITTPAFCQDWGVMNSTDKFNFRLDNDPVITLTVWADSVQWNGADSVFYLNRVMCDTCVTIVGGPSFCDTCYGQKNLPHFLNRECRVSVTGTVHFQDTGSVALLPKAALNDSWTLDTAQAITATVSGIGQDTVFGTLDSVKIIVLSTTDTIRLAKSYGILQYPNGYGQNSYYRLAGIEGRNVGEQVPRFSAFYDMDVGDMFEYHGTSYFMRSNCWSSQQSCIWTKKIVIQSKAVNGDTITYGITGHERLSCTVITAPWPPACTSYNLIAETRVFVDSAHHWSNRYPNETVKMENILDTNMYIDGLVLPCGQNDSAYDYLKVIQDTTNRISKSLGISAPWCQGCYAYQSVFSGTTDTLYSLDYWYAFGEVVTEGLGPTHIVASGCFEAFYDEYLTAYRKGNDTIGVFTPDSVLSVVPEQEVIPIVRVYPIPGYEYLIVEREVPEDAELAIRDLQGKLLMIQKVERKKEEIDIQSLAAGIYVLSIRSREWVFTRKFYKLAK